ncbi:WD repeat-containing protein 75-like [Ruditapes philippinarum]|uniref:WD repeat-containing protein 75-like n=1 Tax=Ruditapes philippinarum TaxID=129788 RepID=UPI00295B8390|nr:WD repeat-containing protein 75-like [Ruditapes philippinarum]
MAAPMRHMDHNPVKVYFPLKSGASLVKTKPVFSLDEKWLFVCSGSVIKVFSISSGECVRELRGHRNYVTGIVIHPLNKLQLVSCSLDQKIIVWDYSDGVLLREIHVDSKLYALYTIKDHEMLYLLQQNPSNKTACDLVMRTIKKLKGPPRSTCLFQRCSTDCRKTCIGPKVRDHVKEFLTVLTHLC